VVTSSVGRVCSRYFTRLTLLSVISQTSTSLTHLAVVKTTSRVSNVSRLQSRSHCRQRFAQKKHCECLFRPQCELMHGTSLFCYSDSTLWSRQGREGSAHAETRKHHGDCRRSKKTAGTQTAYSKRSFAALSAHRSLSRYQRY